MVNNPPANVGDTGHPVSIPELGRSPGGGMAIHSSILPRRIPDRGAWQATVHGITKSQIQLSDISDISDSQIYLSDRYIYP